MNQMRLYCAAGNAVSFSSFKGKVVLVTNVACFCGYTDSNYKELAALLDKYQAAGLEVRSLLVRTCGSQLHYRVD